MPETITREQLNEAIEQFASKIMEALGATVADEEVSEPELTGTYFKAICLDGIEHTVDATEFGVGTVIVDSAFEFFRCIEGQDIPGPWVRYSGTTWTHEEFAAEMRETCPTPRIIHEG